jgi:hypothetical protein
LRIRFGEVRGIRFVSGLHTLRDLDLSIILNKGNPWMSVAVIDDAPAHRYIISTNGGVWESPNGIDRGEEMLAPLYDDQAPRVDSAITTEPDDVRHVGELINHIAHLNDIQVTEIRTTLNNWLEASTHNEGGISATGSD